MDAIFEALAVGVRGTILIFQVIFRLLSFGLGGAIAIADKAGQSGTPKLGKRQPFYYEHQITANICPKCQTKNEDNQDVCYYCGEALHKGVAKIYSGMAPPEKIPGWMIILLVVLAIFVVLILLSNC